MCERVTNHLNSETFYTVVPPRGYRDVRTTTPYVGVIRTGHEAGGRDRDFLFCKPPNVTCRSTLDLEEDL